MEVGGGGSVSDTGDVLWNGTPAFEVIITADLTQYSHLVVSFEGNDDEIINGTFTEFNNLKWYCEPNEIAYLTYQKPEWKVVSITKVTRVTGYK